MSETLGTWIDGIRADSLPADDRGLHYGDGLFETLLIRAGRPRFLEAHLARLALGCLRLKIHFAAMQNLRAEIAAAATLAPPLALLKIIVTRGSVVRRGYAPSGTETARRIVSLWPAAELPESLGGGAHLIIAAHKVAVNPALAGIKHLSRLANVLAAAESIAAGSFEALMLDSSDRVISGAMSNVFMVREGGVLTPPVDSCGVAGVMRGVVLREGVVLGIGVREGDITRSELYAADEVFITNARIGVVRVSRVGEHSYRMNTISQRLKTHIETLDA